VQAAKADTSSPPAGTSAEEPSPAHTVEPGKHNGQAGNKLSTRGPPSGEFVDGNRPGTAGTRESPGTGNGEDGSGMGAGTMTAGGAGRGAAASAGAGTVATGAGPTAAGMAVDAGLAKRKTSTKRSPGVPAGALAGVKQPMRLNSRITPSHVKERSALSARDREVAPRSSKSSRHSGLWSNSRARATRESEIIRSPTAAKTFCLGLWSAPSLCAASRASSPHRATTSAGTAAL